MERFRIVMVGGGMVAGYCLKELGKLGVGAGEVCLLSADTVAPYQRPPLSKDFLEDRKPAEKVFVNKEEFYADTGLELRLGTAVTALDPAAKTVAAGDTVVGYEQLVLATGSAVRRLDLPGAGLDGVLTLRTFDDGVRLKEAAAQARRAVIIGGGFIGTEVAARLNQQGLDVTMLYREEGLLNFFLPPELSQLYEGRCRDHGIHLLPGLEPAEFVGDGALQGVRLKNGETLAADLALMAVGVTPQVELAQAAGLAVDRFVTVNEFLQTSAPDILAGGDMIAFPDPYFGVARHVEHEEHARRSGRHIAQMLLGERKPYDYLAMVWSDVYDLSWEFWGEWREADRIVYRGDLPSANFSAWWLRGGRVIGAMITEHRRDAEAQVAQDWIKQGQTIDPATLENDSQPLG